MVRFVFRKYRNGNRFYDHELAKIIDPDLFKPAAFSSVEGVGLGARTNQGTVLNVFREKFGVNDRTGKIQFQDTPEFACKTYVKEW